MCSLPNIQVRDPEEPLPHEKKQVEKTEAKTVKIIIPYYPTMETHHKKNKNHKT